MSKLPQVMTKPTTARRPPAPPAAPAPAIQWFRVVSDDKKVQRPQGDFILKRGKEINSANFDVTKLRNMGVELTPIPPPGWWLEQQRAAVQKHAELAERGIDLGDPADPAIFDPSTPDVAPSSST